MLSHNVGGSHPTEKSGKQSFNQTAIITKHCIYKMPAVPLPYFSSLHATNVTGLLNVGADLLSKGQPVMQRMGTPPIGGGSDLGDVPRRQTQIVRCISLFGRKWAFGCGCAGTPVTERVAICIPSAESNFSHPRQSKRKLIISSTNSPSLAGRNRGSQFQGVSVLICRFMKGVKRLRPVSKRLVPSWDLSTVLNALTHALNHSGEYSY